MVFKHIPVGPVIAESHRLVNCNHLCGGISCSREGEACKIRNKDMWSD